MLKNSLRNVVLCVLVLACGSISWAGEQPPMDSHDSKPLILGVAPFMSPVALANRLEPLRQQLSKRLKQPIRLETTKNPREFTYRTTSKRYDVVLTSPTFALLALDQGYYRLMATQKEQMQGHILVMNDSPVKTLDDLANKIVGAPPERGFIGQLSRHYLKRQGLSGTRAPAMIYFHSHNDAFYALRMNNLDAAFVSNIVTQHLQEKHIPIRIVGQTQPYPGLTFLISPEIPPQQQQRIQSILLTLHKDSEGAQALDQASLPPFTAISRAQLETVRPFVADMQN